MRVGAELGAGHDRGLGLRGRRRVVVSGAVIYVCAPVVVELGVAIGRHLYVTAAGLRGGLRMAANFVVVDVVAHEGLQYRQVPCPGGTITARHADACAAILSGEYHALEGLSRSGGPGWLSAPVMARLMGKRYVAFRREAGAVMSVSGVARLNELRGWVA